MSLTPHLVISLNRSFNFLLSLPFKSLFYLPLDWILIFFFHCFCVSFSIFCLFALLNTKIISIRTRRLKFCTTHQKTKSDQNNPAFNIHHIPSSISLDTPSERSASAEPSNHDQKSNLNLPNGNLPNKSRTPSIASTPSTILTITNEQDAPYQEPSNRKLSKLTIMEPIDSIC